MKVIKLLWACEYTRTQDPSIVNSGRRSYADTVIKYLTVSKDRGCVGTFGKEALILEAAGASNGRRYYVTLHCRLTWKVNGVFTR